MRHTSPTRSMRRTAAMLLRSLWGGRSRAPFRLLRASQRRSLSLEPPAKMPSPAGRGLRTCLARHCSAELYSAVSQSCTLRVAGKARRRWSIRHLAEYNSAIQQIENLRYGRGSAGR